MMVIGRYSLPGVQNPHGIALDVANRIAFIAGEENHSLAVFDLRSMKLLSVHPVGDDPDVLAFDPEILRQVFNDTVEASEENKGDKSRLKIPVFVPLDDVRNSRTKRVRPGIGIKAAWQVQIPLGRLPTQSSALGNEDYRARFYEDIKKQIADFVGVDVSKIVLEIRINP